MTQAQEHSTDLPARAEPRERRPGSYGLLWNASSGWKDSDAARETVRAILAGEGASVEVRQVQRGMDLPEECRSLVARGAEVLVAAGGDGTINAAASALIRQSAALGVIPAGTLNHFARDLEIPLDAEQAARVLAEGRVIPIDMGAVNGRVFINNSVLGLFPNYRKVREAWDRRGFGGSRIGRFFATMVALWTVFWRLPHLTVSFLADGRRRTLRTPFVLIGNNEHRMEGWALGRRSNLDRGTLWVYVLRPCSRWRLLKLVLGLVLGRAHRESMFETFPATELVIDCKKRRVGVGIDGEMVRMRAPLHYESLPGALRVIAPASSPLAGGNAD